MEEQRPPSGKPPVFALLELEKTVRARQKVLSISQFRKLTESDFANISRVLQENHSFLEEISISNQMISGKSLNLLGSGLHLNTYITSFSLVSNSILSDFSEFSFHLQSASTLHYLDLSKNQLTDLQGSALIKFIEASSISTVILDSNQFKSLDFSKCIRMNNYLEEFSISNNPLGISEVLNIIEAVSYSKSLKILGLQGYNNILFDRKLAQMLRMSLLVVLRYDLDISDLEIIKGIERTLIRRNRCLVSIESKGIDWDNISSKHPLLQIKRALKANLWLSQNDVLPSECNDEIFLDVQDVVIQKQNNENNSSYEIEPANNEEEMIALEYDKVPDTGVISENLPLGIVRDSRIDNFMEQCENIERNLMQSAKNDKSIVKIEKPLINNEESINRADARNERALENSARSNERFMEMLEVFEQKFEKTMGKLVDKVDKIEAKIEYQKEEVDNLKGIITGRLNKIAEKIESEMLELNTKYKQTSNKIEERIIRIENKEERKVGMLKEIADQYENAKENFKDIDARIDQIEEFRKSLSVSETQQKAKKFVEAPELRMKFEDLSLVIQEIQESLKELSLKAIKIDSAEDSSKKNSAKIDSLKQEIATMKNSSDKSLMNFEEKLSEIHRLKPQISSLQKEVYAKISSIDLRLIETSENSSIHELTSKTASLETRVSTLEERISKSLIETVYSIKHRDQLIETRLAYLEQERLNIEELKNKLAFRSESDGFKESFSLKTEKSLDERIASLEKLSFTKKKQNPNDHHSEFKLSDSLPEEAHSIILTSVIDKVNKQRNKDLYSKVQDKYKKNY